jgi:hypothetical protein
MVGNGPARSPKMNSIPHMTNIWGRHWMVVSAAYLVTQQWTYITIETLQGWARDADRARIVLW